MPTLLCDLYAGYSVDSEGKENVFCCDKLINVVKGLDFVLLFMGFFFFFRLSNGVFILDTKKMSTYQERMWEFTVQRT